jgi:hypothetical protein
MTSHYRGLKATATFIPALRAEVTVSGRLIALRRQGRNATEPSLTLPPIETPHAPHFMVAVHAAAA